MQHTSAIKAFLTNMCIAEFIFNLMQAPSFKTNFVQGSSIYKSFCKLVYGGQTITNVLAISNLSNFLYLLMAKKISCCTSFLFSRCFSSLRKHKHQQGNEEKSPQSSAALSIWLPQKSLAPPCAREVSSPAALALSCLNWVLADSSSSVPSSGRTR